jgi:hypothetical protein
MIVDQIAHRCGSERCRLEARVRSEAWSREEFVVWYETPGDLVAQHDNPPDGSPFVPAFLLWCMRRDETLTIDGTASSRLLGTLSHQMRVLRAMWPDVLTPVTVNATPFELSPGQHGIGSFFTGGVDSWYTATTYGRLPEDRGHLRALIYVPSVDMMYDSETRDDFSRSLAKRIAGLGMTPVLIDTNLRQWTERFLHWGYYHGAGLASIALTTGLELVIIPAGVSYGTICRDGSHLLLDHGWSTERTAIGSHGAEGTRFDKLKELSSRDDIMSALKICHDENTLRNCGRCRKCLLTMAMLHTLGALDATAFDAPFDLRALARTNMEGLFDVFSGDLLQEVQDPRVRRAIRIALLRERAYYASLEMREVVRTFSAGDKALHAYDRVRRSREPRRGAWR